MSRRCGLIALLFSASSVLLGGCPTAVEVPAITPDSAGSASSSVAGASNVASRPALDCREPADVVSLRNQVIDAVNEERTKRGFGILVRNPTLEDQADTYACELIQYDFFAHENPVTGSTLRDRSNQFHYDYRTIGENLAAGQQSVEQVMTDWMNSPGHAENILRPEFTEIGIGIRLGGDYGMYWVQEFGQPARNPRP